ncbi:conserved Plasmodium protein, unknown function [Plasmodium reichenowi]|uniref:CS domain-containing protein n=1 Tax=Plasmodium reichenowi TaxID=5854 RepID=A0A060RWD1_PLARE|nr:hypothetical protein PRSY57_1250400 [Plasmodium reichenowi]KYN95609.1 hypothetical protein PRSY57_1250400 [Plasmodium reichenowi]CDO65782.1 conserved Plasmodium protein, unknown function [Plasmodium reichenowi]
MTNILFFFNILWMSILFVSANVDKEVPTVKWGQNSSQLTLIVSIPKIEKEEIQFKENIIYVSAINKDGKHYELILNLLRPIIPENCSYSVLQKGLKLKVHKQIKEPCWKRLTKEKEKQHFLIKDKILGDGNDCEEAKEIWFSYYMFHKRKMNSPPSKNKSNKKKDLVENIIENLKNEHPNFSLHEY